MSRQTDLLALNTPTTTARYRFTLSNATFGTLILTHAPDGWKEDEYTFKRDMKRFGVFRSFASTELKFIKEGRDYIQNVYEGFGVNAEVSLKVEIRSSMGAWSTRFTGKIDFSTYKVSELSADVQVIDGNFTDLILDRSATPVNVLSTTSIDGDTITPAVKSIVTIPDIYINNQGLFKQDTSVTSLTGSHVMPITLQSSTFTDGELQTPGQYLNQLAGAFYKDSVAARTDVEVHMSLHIVVSGPTGCNIQIDAWNGGSFRANLFDQRYDGAIGLVYIEGTFDMDLADYLLLQVISDNATTVYRYYKADFMIYDNLSTITSRVIYGILYKEAFRALVAQYTGQDNAVSSSIFNDTFKGVVTNGRYFRGITGVNPAISLSFDDLFQSLSLLNIGVGVELISGAETLVIERMSYFFQSLVILDLSGRINESLIRKEVIPELYANRLKFGFDSYDYDYSGGVYEFNTASEWSTVIKRINSEFAIVSKLRGDSTGIFKALSEIDNSKDTDGDEDNYMLDVVVNGSNYKARTDEGFDMIIGAASTFQMFNLDYSPARTLRRWGSYIRAMLRQNGSSYLRWQASDKNTTIKSQLTGEDIVAENGDVLVKDLDANLWINERYVCEVPLSESDFDAISANPFGLIKLSDTKYGWILEYKSKNDAGTATVQLLRANLAAINPQMLGQIKYGRLYNFYVVSDARNVCATGYHIMTLAEWYIIANYVNDPDYLGGHLKEVGLTYWNDPNTGADNTTGLSLRGSGLRWANGTFEKLKQEGYFWLDNFNGDDTSTVVGALYNSAINGGGAAYINDGLSLRPVKDSTTLQEGEHGWYRGNDGTYYRTVVIAGLEVVAENLAETMYRNGDPIPESTDPAQWAEVTTGRRCDYNNDPTNVFI